MLTYEELPDRMRETIVDLADRYFEDLLERSIFLDDFARAFLEGRIQTRDGVARYSFDRRDGYSLNVAYDPVTFEPVPLFTGAERSMDTLPRRARRLVERVRRTDKKWFKRHPSATVRLRPYVDGEFGCPPEMLAAEYGIPIAGSGLLTQCVRWPQTGEMEWGLIAGPPGVPLDRALAVVREISGGRHD